MLGCLLPWHVINTTRSRTSLTIKILILFCIYISHITTDTMMGVSVQGLYNKGTATLDWDVIESLKIRNGPDSWEKGEPLSSAVGMRVCFSAPAATDTSAVLARSTTSKAKEKKSELTVKFDDWVVVGYKQNEKKWTEFARVCAIRQYRTLTGGTKARACIVWGFHVEETDPSLYDRTMSARIVDHCKLDGKSMVLGNWFDINDIETISGKVAGEVDARGVVLTEDVRK